jgi:hypothetical protein
MEMDQEDKRRNYESYDHDNLPPSAQEGHKRSWSGGVNLLGTERLMSSFTPPIFTRKRVITVEDERQKFHLNNQAFLKSIPKRKNVPFPSAQNTFRKSTKTCIYLESIGDDDREQEEESSLKGVHFSSESLKTMISKDSSDDINNEVLQPRLESCHEYENLYEPMVRPRSGATYSETQQLMREYAFELEKERESLIEKWRAEFEAELEADLQVKEQQAGKGSSVYQLIKFLEVCLQDASSAIATVEVMICNMPLSISASALSWATLGVVWYKFGAEHLTMQGKCKVVNFHDAENTYPKEFPGSFSCDPTLWYKGFLYFHFLCHSFAALLAFIFILKVLLSWKSVHDDLTNPVTATPVGVICITLEVLFAAAGDIGSLGVILTSIFHSIFAVWYVYVSVAKFKLLPDPSWFPGTVGLAYAAVKSWLISNATGKLFLGVRADLI